MSADSIATNPSGESFAPSEESLPPPPPPTLSQLQQRNRSYEAQLREVTAAASALATDFMSAREQLANENAYLAARAAELTAARADRHAAVARLAEEYLRLDRSNEDLERRLGEVRQHFAGMGRQRTQLLGKVDDWEDGLMVAGREGWRSRTPRTPGDGAAEGKFTFQEDAKEEEEEDAKEEEEEPPVVQSSSTADSSEAVLEGGINNLASF